MILLHVLIFALGVAVVGYTLLSATRTFVLPRSAPDLLTRVVFGAVGALFGLRLRGASSYGERDRVMAIYAPTTLLVLLVAWLSSVLGGYMLMFWSLGVRPWRNAFTLSGSSLLTLGFAVATSVPTTALAFSEATIGLILVALLISYLPTMYASFSRREAAVALLAVRAGEPPSAVEMLERFQRIKGFGRLSDQWTTWEAWFVDIEESHTSLTPLVFFRSPQPERSWVTAAGTVLDAAALMASTVDQPRDPQAELCIRAGYLALKRIADFFRISYDPLPPPDDPHSASRISISRAQYDEVCERMRASGIPLKPDREQSWRDFAGWRVTYDSVLLGLAGLTMAPAAPWSTDLLAQRPRPRLSLKRIKHMHRRADA